MPTQECVTLSPYGSGACECVSCVFRQREELRGAFHAFDKDKTGKLDVNEMKYLLKSIGVCLSRREQKALEAGKNDVFNYFVKIPDYSRKVCYTCVCMSLCLPWRFRPFLLLPPCCVYFCTVAQGDSASTPFCGHMQLTCSGGRCVLALSEFADRGEFDYEDLLTIGQVVYNDVAIERALVLALRRLAPSGAKSVPRGALRELLLNLGGFFMLLCTMA